eukprot:1360345-Rhodomonas_salina.1
MKTFVDKFNDSTEYKSPDPNPTPTACHERPTSPPTSARPRTPRDAAPPRVLRHGHRARGRGAGAVRCHAHHAREDGQLHADLGRRDARDHGAHLRRVLRRRRRPARAERVVHPAARARVRRRDLHARAELELHAALHRRARAPTVGPHSDALHRPRHRAADDRDGEAALHRLRVPRLRVAHRQ